MNFGNVHVIQAPKSDRREYNVPSVESLLPVLEAFLNPSPNPVLSSPQHTAEPPTTSNARPLRCSPPSLPSKLTQHLSSPSLSTALSSFASAPASVSDIHSTGAPTAPAVLPVTTQHRCME
ncbi:hypothetical protein BLNAU_10082 [Blattamonas nauphoetae]|uniref:Uncharacterized protein n=1 Tax=Blattamonas nauphoetae TaxID=2049346 RepID=A0ABQ9XTY5_9EUKA|nr:hypothetical protein BLNAU_10082 [Blattamonas nauphoetae]